MKVKLIYNSSFTLSFYNIFFIYISEKKFFIGGYFFIANGALTPSALAVRNLSFKLADRYAYYCKVQFSYRVREQPEIAITMFDQHASDLLQSLLPQLMRSLPDWPALESPSSPPAVSSS